MNCITCNRNEATCDNYCVECEIKFFRANPLEHLDLISQVEKDPDNFAAWIPVVKALDEAV